MNLNLLMIMMPSLCNLTEERPAALGNHPGPVSGHRRTAGYVMILGVGDDAGHP
jgi:hypothetical protein